MPHYMVITKGYGISIEQIEMSTPKKMEIYEKAWQKQQEINDALCWQMGVYVHKAVCVALDQGFNGTKAKSEYPVEPIFIKAMNESQLTQEEIDNRELQKMLAIEKAWKVNDDLRGLPTANSQIKAIDY